MLKRLSHVCLSARDPARTIAFYRDVLGCAVAHEFHNGVGELYGAPQLVDLATEMGFRSMVFSLNLNDFGLEHWRERNNAVTVENEFTHAEAMDLMARGERHGIAVRFWRVAEKYLTGNPDTLCPWPFERAYVSSDLRLVPCCIISNPDVSELGDARDIRLVWFGERTAAFRAAHLRGDIPQECRSCYDLRDHTA